MTIEEHEKAKRLLNNISFIEDEIISFKERKEGKYEHEWAKYKKTKELSKIYKDYCNKMILALQKLLDKKEKEFLDL